MVSRTSTARLRKRSNLPYVEDRPTSLPDPANDHPAQYVVWCEEDILPYPGDDHPPGVKNEELDPTPEQLEEAQQILALFLDQWPEATIERVSAYKMRTHHSTEWPEFEREMYDCRTQAEVTAVRDKWTGAIYRWPPRWRDLANDISARQRGWIYKTTGERYVRKR